MCEFEYETYRTDVLLNSRRDYSEDDIFNAVGIGPFYKCLPNKTLALKTEKCYGGKHSKERIIVLVAANMSGSEKLKLLVIGKSAKPRCFRSVRSLLVF